VSVWIRAISSQPRQNFGYQFRIDAHARAKQGLANRSPKFWRALAWQGGRGQEPNSPYICNQARIYKSPSRIRIRVAFLYLQVIFESLYRSTSLMGRTRYTNPWVLEGHTDIIMGQRKYKVRIGHDGVCTKKNMQRVSDTRNKNQARIRQEIGLVKRPSFTKPHLPFFVSLASSLPSLPPA
jgi:hypothetical protein